MEKMDKDPKGSKTLPTIFDFYTEVHQPCPHHFNGARMILPHPAHFCTQPRRQQRVCSKRLMWITCN